MAIQNSKERIEAVEVDINDTSLADGIETEFDLKADFQARACPPPGRTDLNKPKLYKFKVFADDSTFDQNTKVGFKADDPNGKYYTKQLILKLQDPSGVWQDSVCYYKVSTGIPKGKKLSSMAGVLVMLNIKVPQKSTDKYIAQLLIKALEQLDSKDKNYLIGDADWSAWDKTKTSKRAEFGAQAILSNGKVASSMTNFPKNPDGTYQHICHTKDGLEVIASLKILKLHPIAVKKAEPEAAVKSVASVTPTPTPKPQAKPVEEVIESVGDIVMGDDGEVVLDL